MPVIEVSGLTKKFGENIAVDNLSFDVEEGEILVIVGASGCGKTTTLRSIAGLDIPTAGTVRVDGRMVVADGHFVPPEKRGIGMVFQSYALWPHKTVAQNVAYPLEVSRQPKGQIREAVERALKLVGLAGMGDRYPSTLSGGQQQRVALARVAVAEPRVLLLDEPLSNLDAKLREQMQFELKQLIKAIKSTAIHITHDQTEAMAIADKIIVMRDGRAEQSGTGREIYRRPVNRFVADFIGVASFVDGEVLERTGPEEVRVAAGPQISLLARPSVEAAASGAVTLCLRPEVAQISKIRPEGENVVKGRIIEEAFLGDHISYAISVGDHTIRAKSQDDFVAGDEIFVQMSPQRLIAIPRDADSSTYAQAAE